MKELEAVKKQYKKLGDRIKQLEKKQKEEDKGFDFRVWYDENEFKPPLVFQDLYDSDSENIFNNLNNGIVSEEFDYHCRIQAEYIIKKHWDIINDGWPSDWNDFKECKNYLSYNYEEDKILYGVTSHWQEHPSWFYFNDEKINNFLEEAERMKALYGVDLVTYYLTGEIK